MAVCRVFHRDFHSRENIGQTCSPNNLCHSFVQHVGLLDLQLVCAIQPIDLVWLQQRSQRDRFFYPKFSQLRYLSLSGLACCSTRRRYPNSCNVISLCLQKIAQIVNLCLVLQFKDTNIDTTRPFICMINCNPIESSIPGNASQPCTASTNFYKNQIVQQLSCKLSLLCVVEGFSVALLKWTLLKW